VSIGSVEEAGTAAYHAPRPLRDTIPRASDPAPGLGPGRRRRLHLPVGWTKDLVGSTQNWSVTGFGLRLSATFN